MKVAGPPFWIRGIYGEHERFRWAMQARIRVEQIYNFSMGMDLDRIVIFWIVICSMRMKIFIFGYLDIGRFLGALNNVIIIDIKIFLLWNYSQLKLPIIISKNAQKKILSILKRFWIGALKNVIITFTDEITHVSYL